MTTDNEWAAALDRVCQERDDAREQLKEAQMQALASAGQAQDALEAATVALAKLEVAEEALQKIAKPTRGSELSWSAEERANYFASKFFNGQRIARNALQKWKDLNND